MYMGNSLVKVSVHIIFHVKSTGNVIKEEHLARVFSFIGGTIRAMEGCAYTIGGMPDHIHILSSLPLTMSIADFVRTIKANTSRWIKGLDSSYENFKWQEGYAAFSVSESNKEAVTAYIDNQATHHRKYTTHEEFMLFLLKNGIQVENIIYPH